MRTWTLRPRGALAETCAGDLGTLCTMMETVTTVKPRIPLSEYVARRERVLRGLKGAVGMVLAGEGAPPLLGKWRPDFNFLYLTGLENESGAAVLFDPTAENPKRRCILLLRPLNPEAERWDGYRQEISESLRRRLGFQAVMRANTLPMLLAQAVRRAKRLACLHPFAAHTDSISPDLTIFRKVCERVPGAGIEDQTDLLPSLRAIKSRAELVLMKRAILATAAGYDAAVRVIRPGVTEMAVQQTMENVYREHGAIGPAYNSIVGAGLSGTVLHYMDNSGVGAPGELMVIDSGAEYAGYAADVTRTFPVSGRFTREQREIYNIVLRAQLAAIRAVRPGARMHRVDQAARDVIERAGYGDAYMHGIGHQLGMEVHDVTPDGPLKAGMIITIEPGIYLPEKKMGIRIEDEVVVTSTGCRDLTAMIPKTVEEIEAAMRRGAR